MKTDLIIVPLVQLWEIISSTCIFYFFHGSVCSSPDWRILLYVLVLSWLSQSVDIDAAVSIWICRTAERDKTMPNTKIQRKWKLEWTLFSKQEQRKPGNEERLYLSQRQLQLLDHEFFFFSCLYLLLATMLKRGATGIQTIRQIRNLYPVVCTKRCIRTQSCQDYCME